MDTESSDLLVDDGVDGALAVIHYAVFMECLQAIALGERAEVGGRSIRVPSALVEGTAPAVIGEWLTLFPYEIEWLRGVAGAVGRGSAVDAEEVDEVLASARRITGALAHVISKQDLKSICIQIQRIYRSEADYRPGLT